MGLKIQAAQARRVPCGKADQCKTCREEGGHTLSSGQTWRLYYSAGNFNNRIWHIRAIIDDEYVVMRHWSRRRRGWAYAVEHVTWFDIHGSFLKLEKNGK